MTKIKRAKGKSPLEKNDVISAVLREKEKEDQKHGRRIQQLIQTVEKQRDLYQAEVERLNKTIEALRGGLAVPVPKGRGMKPVGVSSGKKAKSGLEGRITVPVAILKALESGEKMNGATVQSKVSSIIGKKASNVYGYLGKMVKQGKLAVDADKMYQVKP